MLNISLKVSSIKESEAKIIKENTGAARIDLVPKSIIICWVRVAKSMKAVFSNEFTTENYKNLQDCLQDELIILPKV